MSEEPLRQSIFERELAGQVISTKDEEYLAIHKIIRKAQTLTAKLNTGYHEMDEIRHIFSEITNSEIDESFRMNPPFYTDYGHNIHIGKSVFINFNCVFMDRGGIFLDDYALIGPGVHLLTTNHIENPFSRESTQSRPIHIGKRVWLGGNVTVLPGITIGDNSIVGAGSVVIQNVPANVIVAGNPARIIRSLTK
ncbi:sugar O-acetyltransferase [Veillonella criceti]|uniref:Maltose O-acetyltransferase n=1 Tax=Veillonella criceti TaxID=103891 RepID=A0A380NJ32_9FIRM|nr:sugar O-acetyltransferase [Veillonella criceti]SUP41757.1 Maltose O-acetyltransferase [Veillonella criceti]